MKKSHITTPAGSRYPHRTLIVLATVLSAAAAAVADESLASLVPPDVGLFVELRKADDLLIPLTEPQLWVTLAQLGGQPASTADTELWRRGIQQTVGMTPEEAIRTLFSQRVAFVGQGPQETQDTVILCRPITNPRELVAGWKAKPLPTSGRTSVYRLPNDVSAAIRGDVLIFGDTVADGMFQRVVKRLDAGPSPGLESDPDYRRLLARLADEPDGVLFARLSRATPTTLATTAAPTTPATSGTAQTQPATVSTTGPSARQAARRPTAAQAARVALPDWSSLLGRSSTVLLGLHREGRLLRFSAVGNASSLPPVEDGVLDDLVLNLPERTLLAWAARVDYAMLTPAVAALPEQSVLRVAYDLHAKRGTIQRLTESLDSTMCVAAGVVTPQDRLLPAPPVPALAVLLRSRQPETTTAEWRDLLHYTLDIYRLLALNAPSAPQLPPLEAFSAAGVEAERVDLSPLLGLDAAHSPLGQLDFCWAMDGDVLIVASHSDWLRQILAARHGAAPRLTGVLRLGGGRPSEQRQTVLVAQPGPIADLGTIWLRYFEQTAPAVLDAKWWRRYQPGGGRVRLGVQVAVDPDRHRIRVQSVTPGTPAEGALRAGDEIVGCSGRRFATSQPIRELHRALADRPDAGSFDLWVERDARARVYRLRLPFVDPVQILRRIIAVGKIVQRVVYCDDVPNAEGSRGSLTLELRGEQGPLFAFALTPATAPTSAPATATAANALPGDAAGSRATDPPP